MDASMCVVQVTVEITAESLGPQAKEDVLGVAFDLNSAPADLSIPLEHIVGLTLTGTLDKEVLISNDGVNGANDIGLDIQCGSIPVPFDAGECWMCWKSFSRV
jgi:hypothetical protein